MSDEIIIGIILVLAIAFVVYRVFLRPSCGCGEGCGNCSSKGKKSSSAQHSCCHTKGLTISNNEQLENKRKETSCECGK